MSFKTLDTINKELQRLGAKRDKDNQLDPMDADLFVQYAKLKTDILKAFKPSNPAEEARLQAEIEDFTTQELLDIVMLDEVPIKNDSSTNKPTRKKAKKPNS